jgi:hypothetical protein
LAGLFELMTTLLRVGKSVFRGGVVMSQIVPGTQAGNS